MASRWMLPILPATALLSEYYSKIYEVIHKSVEGRKDLVPVGMARRRICRTVSVREHRSQRDWKIFNGSTATDNEIFQTHELNVLRQTSQHHRIIREGSRRNSLCVYVFVWGKWKFPNWESRSTWWNRKLVHTPPKYQNHFPSLTAAPFVLIKKISDARARFSWSWQNERDIFDIKGKSV